MLRPPVLSPLLSRVGIDPAPSFVLSSPQLYYHRRQRHVAGLSAFQRAAVGCEAAGPPGDFHSHRNPAGFGVAVR